MGIILYQLFYGYSIYSLVSFNNRLFRIEEIKLIHPFINKNELFRSTLKDPFWFLITLRNEYDGIEVVGHKVVKSPYKVKFFSWSKLPLNLK